MNEQECVVYKYMRVHFAIIRYFETVYIYILKRKQLKYNLCLNENTEGVQYKFYSLLHHTIPDVIKYKTFKN